MTTSSSGNPLGAWVEPSAAAATAELPKQISATVPGRLVTLVHGYSSRVDELFAVLGGEENASIWDYIPMGPFQSREELRACFASQWQNTDIFFTIIDNSTQKAEGFLTLTNIDRANRSVEIGNLVFSKDLQRRAAATEVMYLLGCYAFDNLGARRLEGRCHSLNGPSYRAALRGGFKVEGVFRQHMVLRGRNRDTTWFSILDGEWPTVKRGFERWLDEGNFDSDGRQRKSLTELRDAV